MTVVFARLAVDVFAPHLAVNKTNRPRFWFRTSRPQCQTDPLAQKKGHSLESHPSATHQPSISLGGTASATHQPGRIWVPRNLEVGPLSSAAFLGVHGVPHRSGLGRPRAGAAGSSRNGRNEHTIALALAL